MLRFAEHGILTKCNSEITEYELQSTITKYQIHGNICDMIKGNESLVENFNFNFLHQFIITLKCFILVGLQLYIWLQSYEAFVNAKHNIK